MKATEEQIVNAIMEYERTHGYSPSVRDVCVAVGIKSASAVKYRLERMREKGLVTYVDRTPRTLKVVK